MSKKYTPIPSDFRLIIEDHIKKSFEVFIQYYDKQDIAHKVEGRLKKLITIDGKEYLTLQNGEDIRVDLIISINEHESPFYGKDDFHHAVCAS